MGIDLGGTRILVVVLDQDGSILASAQEATGDVREIEPVLDRIASVANSAMAHAEVSGTDLVSVGIGVPGEVDAAGGVLRLSPILPDWKNVAVKRLLEEQFDTVVWVDNDANATLVAEIRFGAARDAESALLLTIGTGIGGALSFAGQLVRGLLGSAGEIGHICVDPAGPPCWCGQRGCLGLLASATALVGYYRNAAEIPGSEPVDGLTVASRYYAGDSAAIYAVGEVSRFLVAGISTAACIVAPQRIVLFGGVVEGLAEPLLAAVRGGLASRHYPAAVSAVEVCSADLGEYAGAIGAAWLPGVGNDTSRQGF